MSSGNPNTNSGTSSKLLFVFIGFIVVIALAFFGMRYNASHAVGQESKEKKADEVIVTKDPQLAEKKQKLLKDTTGDYYLGNKFAPVVVIEYASLACPHCRDFEAEVVEPLIPNYVDKGKVKYIFRDFPHNEAAVPAAKLAHCADPDKYFSFIKVLFKSQDQWAYTKDYLQVLKNIGKLGGIDDAKFDQCMKDKDLENKILQGAKNASDILEVHSVPTIYINGMPFEGPRDYKSVTAVIDAQLKGEETPAAKAPAAK